MDRTDAYFAMVFLKRCKNRPILALKGMIFMDITSLAIGFLLGLAAGLGSGLSIGLGSARNSKRQSEQAEKD